MLYHNFTYGGGSLGSAGDTILSVSQGGSVVSHAYQTSPSKDVWDNPIPRLSATTAGLATDYSSSDDGDTVQGTVSYQFGTVQQGYGTFGIPSQTNRITDARNNVTELIYGYAAPGGGSQTGAIRYLRTTLPTFTGANQPTVWQQTYTPDILKSASSVVTDPLGYPWSTQYTATGKVAETRDPLLHTWTFLWGGDGDSELESVTDPTLVTWLFGYDTVGGGINGSTGGRRLTEITDPSGVVRAQFGYNAYGQIASATVPAAASASGQAETTAFAYDGTTGDTTGVTTPEGTILVGLFDLATRAVVPGSAYDALGDPLGFTVFPDTGNPLTSLAPLSTGLVWAADQQVKEATLPNGLRLVNTYENGVKTRVQSVSPTGGLLGQLDMAYDTRGRLYQTSDLIGTLGQFKYDKSSNLTRISDGRGNSTYFGYGPNNELTDIFTDNWSSSYFQYDPAGRLRESVDPRGIVTTFGYDLANRLTGIALDGHANETIAYVYDDADRLLSVEKASGDRVDFAYNHPNKWLTSVTTTVGIRSRTVAYSYYPDGKRASMVGPAGMTQYSWNAAGQLSHLVQPSGSQTSWTYDNIGRLLSEITTTTAGATIGTLYTWGVSNASGDPSTAKAYLSQITHIVNGQITATYDLTHSSLGQLLAVQQSSSAAGTALTTYGYDARGRLTGETRSRSIGGQTYSGAGVYDYDAADNLNGGASGWSYDADNHLWSAPPAGGLPGASGLSYDAAGNLTAFDGRTLDYDAWGQLSQVSGIPDGNGSGGTHSLSITYDPLGRRWSTSDSSTGQTTYYDYDGSTLIGEEAFSGGSSSGPYQSYHFGANGLIGDSLSSSGGTTSDRYYQYNAQGDTQVVRVASGASQWQQSRGYDAWGNAQEGPTGAAGAPTRFIAGGQGGTFTTTKRRGRNRLTFAMRP